MNVGNLFLFLTFVNLVVGYVLSKAENDYVDIEVPNLGKIRGKVGKSFFTKRPIYHFLGINYAKPPSGERRFKAPEKFGKWPGVYNATKMRQNCPQVESPYYPPLSPDQLDVKSDLEDCLVVNVFVPRKALKENLKFPVMYYIHGGSFFAGSAYEFFPDFLLEEDIILVVVQYRLGILGFLSLNTNEIPGNLGMLDIKLGLEWVQENIAAFGGNKSEVTVAGQSAGSAAASALLISPMIPDGLFHKMILHSGSSLSPWAVDEEPVKSALIMAQSLGCESEDIAKVTECFKKASTEELNKAHAELEYSKIAGCATSLVVQNNTDVKFLTEHPRVLYNKGSFKKIPLMGGFTRDEGISFFPGEVKNVTDNRYFERNITRDVVQFLNIRKEDVDIVADYLHNFYFNGKLTKSFDDVVYGLLDMFSVMLLKASTFENLRAVSQSAPTFTYSFNFKGNVSKLGLSQPQWDQKFPFPQGVPHSDDLGYLFPAFKFNYTQRELRMVKKMTRFWTNFVKYGKPTSPEEWPPLSTAFGPYLRINDKDQIRKNIFDEYVVVTREGFIRSLAGTIKINFLLVLSTLLISQFVNIVIYL